MTKAKTVAPAEELVAFSPGGTDRSIAQLAAATHRLTMRRVRDLLPGKIATRRLVLRAPIRGDVPDLVRLADNKTIAERLARLPSPYTRADAIGFIEIFAQRADERPYAITLNEKLIGVVGFSFFEGKPPELGYWLGEPHWGQGFMTEAARALIEAAHRTGHYQTIAAWALASNAGSLHVLEKLGFRRKAKAKGEIGNIADKPMLRLELERPKWM
jgi:RimJ/RimL family protein N-acetyltransferase